MIQNKKPLLVPGILILALAAAAFLGAKYLYQRTDPVRLSAPFDGDFRSMIVPAPELPTTLPEITGPFIERQDNKIIVETKSIQSGGIGAVTSENAKSQSGPLVEVVVTGETKLYRETTDPGEPLTVENQTILQTVEPGSLDDLNSQAMVMIWGRRSGDRVIADVLLYSDLITVKSAIFEDCEICP